MPFNNCFVASARSTGVCWKIGSGSFRASLNMLLIAFDKEVDYLTFMTLPSLKVITFKYSEAFIKV